MTSVQPSTTTARAVFLGLSRRQVIAVLALANALVATYLHLWKLGLAGSLACGVGHGCVTVQLSTYGWFLGYDVALIGAVGYGLILGTAIVGSLPRFEEARWPTAALLALILPAFAFTLRLKYAEFVVMRTFCPWCAISAVSITLSLVLIGWELRESRQGR